MELDEKDIREFVTLWEEEFGETLSAADARHHASQVLALYQCLAMQPLPPSTDEPRPTQRP